MYIKIAVKVLRKSAIANKNKRMKQRELKVYETFLNHHNDRREKILLGHLVILAGQRPVTGRCSEQH